MNFQGVSQEFPGISCGIPVNFLATPYSLLLFPATPYYLLLFPATPCSSLVLPTTSSFRRNSYSKLLLTTSSYSPLLPPIPCYFLLLAATSSYSLDLSLLTPTHPLRPTLFVHEPGHACSLFVVQQSWNVRASGYSWTRRVP